MKQEIHREKNMEEYLMNNPGHIEPGLIFLGQQFRVNPEGWLGGPDNYEGWPERFTTSSWKIDLVGISQRKELVLCELKYGSGGGYAPLSILEYHNALLLDDEKKRELQRIAEKQIPSIKLDFEKHVSLYIVVAGPVPKVMRKRIELLREAYKAPLKVFQLLPEEEGNGGKVENGWRVKQVEEYLAKP